MTTGEVPTPQLARPLQSMSRTAGIAGARRATCQMTIAAIETVNRQAASVAAVVRDAADRTGVDFAYLMAQARVESGLNPQAKARTSSASGLFQFTASTWLDTVRKHGAAHGLGWAADAIAGGAARAGSAARETILSLRDDAGAAALMAGEFAADNGAALAGKLGRAMGATDLYMAHFLGAGGAGKFLAALQSSPGVAAASLFPAAAAANRGVFYAADGAARSVGEVYARFSAKLEQPLSPLTASAVSRPLPQGERGSVLPASGNQLPVEASRARLAYMLLAELGA